MSLKEHFHKTICQCPGNQNPARALKREAEPFHPVLEGGLYCIRTVGMVNQPLTQAHWHDSLSGENESGRTITRFQRAQRRQTLKACPGVGFQSL
ncbi:MAG: hypothetical protein NVSMB9_28660 [Isosphaeraceae bacterium]